PRRTAFLRKRAAFAAAPAPYSGADLRECRDPGHGSGRPRLVVRHRITSCLVVEPRPLMYGRPGPATSRLRHGGPNAAAIGSPGLLTALEPLRDDAPQRESHAAAAPHIAAGRWLPDFLTPPPC